ncbi:hypothetical protein [Methanoregula sp.]|uniref:hypothetical protein n=1 Tax=Methanoregula sp. TaxID=2052170 RepID=UPI003C786800
MLRIESVTELMDRREMGDFIEMDPLPERVHDLGEFHNVPVIFRQVLFQEKKNE